MSVLDHEPLVDTPRVLSQTRTGGDRTFRGVATAIGLLVLVLTAAIGAFLGYQGIPTLHRSGCQVPSAQ